MAATEELGLEIAVKGFSAFMADMKAADKATDKLATGWEVAGKAATTATGKLTSLSKSVGIMATKTKAALQALQPMGIALSAASASGALLIRSSTMIAARNEELAIVLRTVGENAGYTETQLAKYENAVKGMGITTQSARQALVQMVQANIDLAHSTDLARLAQDAAVIAQVDSSEAFTRLITIIQTGNVLMGRRLGLNLDFANSNKLLAKSLGITTDELTQEQRMQARVNEVMRQGARIAGTYEAAMTTAGKQMRSLNRHWEEARSALGEAFLPMLSRAVMVAGDVLKAFNNLDPGIQKTVSIMLGMGTVVTGMSGAFILLTPRIIATAQAMSTMAPLLIDTGIAFKALVSGAKAAEVASIGFSGVLAVALPIVIAVTAALAALYAAHKTAQKVEEGHTKTSNAWVESLERQVEEGKRAFQIANEYADAQERVSRVLEEASPIARVFVDEQRLARESTEGLSDALMQSSGSYEEYAAASRTAIRATEFTIDAEGNLIHEYERRGEQMREVIQENFLLSESEFVVQSGLNVTTELMELASTTTDAWAERMKDAAGAAGALAAEEEAVAKATAAIDAQMSMLKETMAGPVGEENEKYHDAQAAIRLKIDETTQALIEAEEEFGIVSEEATEHRGKLNDLKGELGELGTKHRETMNMIVFDMLQARLAVDGWTQAEADLALEVAKDMGIIDEETWAAATEMNAALEDFATGTGQAETKATISAIAGQLAGIPRVINVDIRVRRHEERVTATEESGGLVEGQEANYQEGTPFVPRTGPATLHRGEAVLPVPAARAFRQNIANNTTTNQFNLTTQSTTRPGGLAMEFGAMEFAGAGVSR